jgi:hypothetical protein
MKILFSIIFTFLIHVPTFAQIDNVRKLKNYPRNAKLIVTEKQCIISSGQQLDSFAIEKNKANIWHVANIIDENKIDVFNFSDENKNDLKQQYDTLNNKKYAELPLIEQLINRAFDKNKTIVFINDKAVAYTDAVEPEPQNSIDATENDLIPNAKKETNYLSYILGAIAALFAGLFIFEKIKKNKIIQIPNNNGKETNASELADAHQKQIQLQHNNQSLLAQLQQLEYQIKHYKDEDAAYFENALITLVNPAKQALLKQQKKETIELAMRILVQYIAITDTKTDRRQGSDDYNVHAMKGNIEEAFATKQIIIDANTASDAIPNEMKTILQILKDNQADTPRQLAYMGYQTN